MTEAPFDDNDPLENAPALLYAERCVAVSRLQLQAASRVIHAGRLRVCAFPTRRQCNCLLQHRVRQGRAHHHGAGRCAGEAGRAARCVHPVRTVQAPPQTCRVPPWMHFISCLSFCCCLVAAEVPGLTSHHFGVVADVLLQMGISTPKLHAAIASGTVGLPASSSAAGAAAAATGGAAASSGAGITSLGGAAAMPLLTRE